MRADGARLDLFVEQPAGNYIPTSVWSAAKVGFAVAAAQIVAADVNDDSHEKLLLFAPLGKNGAQVLWFAIAASDVTQTSLWKTTKAAFAPAKSQLTTADLNGDGKTDLAIHFKSGAQGHLLGLLSSGSKLTLGPRWQGRTPVAARLAAGPIAGTAKAASFLVAPTSASKGSVTQLTATKKGLAARRVWSGKLGMVSAQLACTDLDGDGAGDLLVPAAKRRAGVSLTVLNAVSKGYVAKCAWPKPSGLPAVSTRLATAPSLPVLLGPKTEVLT